jgi:hypothetical protein
MAHSATYSQIESFVCTLCLLILKALAKFMHRISAIMHCFVSGFIFNT